MTAERIVPTFLCNKKFDEAMLVSFVEFYDKCIASGRKEAIIYIDSPGGYVHVANSMLSLIENTNITFHTVCIGEACSCGLLLLAGGDKRYATDRARMMFHDISAGSYGHCDQMEDDIERMKKLSKDVMERFAKRTKKPLKWWMDQYIKNANRCYWFNEKTAKTVGVIDSIGLPVDKVKTEVEIGVQ